MQLQQQKSSFLTKIRRLTRFPESDRVPGFRKSFGQFSLDVDHRLLDEVSRRTLDRRVDGLPLGRCARVAAVGGVDVRQVPEEITQMKNFEKSTLVGQA